MTFDLDSAVREWIRELRSSRALEEGDLAEFEDHVRDEVEDLVRAGRKPKEAFFAVVGSLEGLDRLDAEFVKARTARGLRPTKIARGILPALGWNYLRVGLRRLRRHKVYGLVNLAGLALGLAAALFVVLYIKHERSYDRHWKNADRIFRVVRPDFTGTPYVLAAGLGKNIPDIETSTAIKHAESAFGSNRLTIAADGRTFEEGACFFVDPTFFSVFETAFLAGSPGRALGHPRAAVLSRSTAQRFFGTTDCLGRVLMVNKTLPFQIEAVVEDPPSHSHFHYSVLLPAEAGPAVSGYEDRASWTSWNYVLYLLLKKNAAPGTVQGKLPWGFPEEFRKSRAGSPNDPANLRLQRLTDIHLRSRLRGEIEPNGDIRWVVFFSAIGLLVLGSAVLNYINLATAQSFRRSREVGMRKVLGAKRGQLVRQFLGEAFLLTGWASLLGLGLLRLVLPALGRTLGTSLSWGDLSKWGTAAVLAGLALVVGLVAGGYPAIFASAFNPVRTLKGFQALEPRRHRVRNGLVLFQFAVSLGFGTAALVILGQLHYLRTKDLGIRHEEIVSLALPQSLRAKADILKRELLRHPGVQIASAANFTLEGGNNQTFDWEGRNEGDDNYVRWFSVDADFVRTFGLRIADGRDFRAGEEAGSEKLYIINRAAAKRFGWDTAVGKRLEVEPFGHPGRVVGVVEDFNFRSLHYPLEAVALLLSPPDSVASTKVGTYRRVPLRSIFLRVAPARLRETLRFVENFVRTHRDESPITWSFLDDEIARLYGRETKTARLLAWFAVAASVLAGLGVFGLSSYMIESRLKEVSVRRILGAAGGRILILFAGEFLRLMLGAAILVFPFVYWQVSGWLDNFAFRIAAWPQFFTAGLALMTLLVLGAVGWPLVRTARGQPSRHLRNE
jgi:putative ABC transport system permease protein